MSKQYFTKYLPVEGEIKEGCTYLDNSLGENTLHKCRAKPSKELIEDKDCHVVELFLCSRDIQVGDKVKCPDPYNGGELDFIITKPFSIGEFAEGVNEKVNEGKPIYMNYGTYKPIGKVSPDAVWVKPDMEFDEKDFKIENHNSIWSQEQCCNKCTNKNWCVRKGCRYPNYVTLFRCPSSPNHFH